jgi:hypothetical protein
MNILEMLVSHKFDRVRDFPVDYCAECGLYESNTIHHTNHEPEVARKLRMMNAAQKMFDLIERLAQHSISNQSFSLILELMDFRADARELVKEIEG